jgi:hypothetical protein
MTIIHLTRASIAVLLLLCGQTALSAGSGCASSGMSIGLLAASTGSNLIESPKVGCNRALSLHLRSARLADEFNGHTPPPAHRWLVTELAFENHMPVDLVLGLNYQEGVLIGSIKRQLFLRVNGARAYRAAQAEQVALDSGFVIPGIGAVAEATVIWPVPEDDLASLSLHYYHDQYRPIAVPSPRRANRIGARLPSNARTTTCWAWPCTAIERVDSFAGQAAPEGMQWLVVDLRGQGNWTTPADARALDVSAPLEDQAELRRVLEYLEAAGLLQVRVDGRHAYRRESSLSSLPENPPLLPDFEVGGLAVFPIPADAGKIELLAQFPQIGGRGISCRHPPNHGFPELEDGPVPSGAETALLEIEDAPVPLRILGIERVDQFAGHQAEDGEELLLLTADHRNLSGNGGMMRISNRLGFQQGVQLEGLYLRGPLALAEPYWLPPGDEAREFQILLRAPAGQDQLDQLDIRYGGVSGQSEHRLDLP